MGVANPTRTSRTEFLKKYIDFYKRGLTRDDLAEELGIKVESVYSRIQVEKRRGNTMPLLPKRGGASSAEVDSLLSELASLNGHSKATPAPDPKPAKPVDSGDDAALEADEIDALLS